MSSNIFNPQVGTLNSAMTPEQGISQVQEVGLFADAAASAVSGGFEIAGNMELNELGRKFSDIAQARKSGKSRDLLMGKARNALNKVKADSPWVADQADQLFRQTFGGGGGGVFEKTPAEKAQEKVAQEVHELAGRLGVAPEEAHKRIAFKAQAEQAAVRADMEKYNKEVNSGVITGALGKELNLTSVSLMTQIQTLSENGSLGLNEVQAIKMGIAQAKSKFIADLHERVRDPRSGHMLVTHEVYKDAMNSIDDWVKNSESLVEDNEYASLISKANTAKKAEISFIAANMYQEMSVAKEAGGQAAVEALIKLVDTPEGTYKEFIKKFNPVAADLYKQEGSFLESVGGGTSKLLLGETKPISLTQAESIAMGTIINDPKNKQTKKLIIERAGEDEASATRISEMTRDNPDSCKVAWDKEYTNWAKTNKEKGKKVSDAVLKGLRTSLLTSYAFANDSADIDFEFVSFSKEEQENLAKVGRAGLTKSNKNRLTGEGLSPEMGAVILNARKVIEANPEVWTSLNEKAGMALSLDLATRYAMTGKLPETEEEPAKKTSEGEDPKKKIEETQKKKVSDETE